MPAFFAACRTRWFSYEGHSTGSTCLVEAYLQGEVLGLVRPRGGYAEDELLLTQEKVVANGGRLNLVQSVLVDGADKVGSNIDGILGQGLAILLEAVVRQVGRLVLVRIKQELHSVDDGVTPVNLATPLELGGVLLIV